MDFRHADLWRVEIIDLLDMMESRSWDAAPAPAEVLSPMAQQPRSGTNAEQNFWWENMEFNAVVAIWSTREFVPQSFSRSLKWNLLHCNAKIITLRVKVAGRKVTILSSQFNRKVTKLSFHFTCLLIPSSSIVLLCADFSVESNTQRKKNYLLFTSFCLSW